MRPARVEDAPAIASLAGELGYPAPAGEIERRLRLVLARPDDGVIVAEDGAGAPAGFAHVVLRATLLSERHAELEALVVGAARRGAGIGRELLVAAERWALARGLGRMRVRSNVARERAHAFYRREGYAIAKTQGVLEKKLVPSA